MSLVFPLRLLKDTPKGEILLKYKSFSFASASLVSVSLSTEVASGTNKKGEPQTLTDFYGDYDTISDTSQWFKQVEYVIFKNELKSIRNNNKVVLKECKENKRLLDLKYNDLNNLVNNIQTSVIFCSTISGFIQATRIQFGIPDNTVSVVSIFISTYISLLLSISKYYKFL